MEIQDIIALISTLIAASGLLMANSTFRLQSRISELIAIRDGLSDSSTSRAYLNEEVGRLADQLVQRIKGRSRLKTVLAWALAAGLTTTLLTYLQEMILGDPTSLSGLQVVLFFGGAMAAIIAGVGYGLVHLEELRKIRERTATSSLSGADPQ